MFCRVLEGFAGDNIILQFDEHFWQIVGIFLGVSIGSTLIGCLLALLCSALLKHLDFRDEPSSEITLVTCFAYAAYSIAEVAHLYINFYY